MLLTVEYFISRIITGCNRFRYTNDFKVLGIYISLEDTIAFKNYSLSKRIKTCP